MLILLSFECIFILFLIIKSRRIKCPDDVGKQLRFLYKISLFILFSPISRKLFDPRIKKKLHILNPASDINVVLIHFYAKKLSLVLLIIFLGIPFISSLSYMYQYSSVLQNNYYLQRGNYGEEAEQITLLVQSAEQIEKIPFLLKSREYTEEEIEQKEKQLVSQLEHFILGSNRDCEHVRSDLLLQEKYSDYPLSIEWLSDDYTVIDSDGTVYNEALTDSKIVQLTADITYKDYEYEHTFSVCVRPKICSEEDKKLRATEKAINDADQSQSHNQDIYLPKVINNQKVTYSLKENTGSITYFIILGLIAGLLYWAKDNDLKKEIEHRNNQILLEYPEFVSQFVLLLGAGMTVRTIIDKMSQSNVWGKYLHKELQILVRDLHNGILEADAFDKFGKRCGNSLYIKFCALLIQNMKKGNRDLLPMLEAEAEQAFQYRKQNAKRLGEEAGTKLLVPMILMLGIVMVIIMVPAFLSFQL